MANNTTIIEVNGVKLEVDLRSAKRVDTLRVGDKVKVLITGQYSTPAVHPGVVVGFEPFEKLPTIVVAYLKQTYNDCDLQFLYYNSSTKDTEVIVSVDDVLFDWKMAFDVFDRKQAKLERDIAELDEKRAYMKRNFGQYFSVIALENAADKED